LNIVGIIAEYNPFHNGHKLHLQKSKLETNSEFSIVVMSGNFVQRGEPAIVDKYLRTKFALLNGADIVIEIPVFCATASAEFFALSAVSLLDSTNMVSSICFGSENGDISTLREIANTLSYETEDFKINLKSQLKSGISYPTARLNSLKALNPESEPEKILVNPNNILAIEYLKALNKINSNIEPFTIKRKVAEYHSTEITCEIASATAIRKSTASKDFELIRMAIPDNTFGLYYDSTFSSFNNLSQILQYILKITDKNSLNEILDITEGLENRILRFSSKYFYIEDIISHVKTKRYTFTKLQRVILHIILNIRVNEFNLLNKYNFAPYLRVLGFKKESSFLLNELKLNASVPLVTNMKNAHTVLNDEQLLFLRKEVETTDIYNLSKGIYNNTVVQKDFEYSVPLVIV